MPWLSTSFKQQTDFILDPAPLKAALCTRRAGKSFGVGEYALMTAYKYPGVSVLILGKTRASVKAIYWKDILTVLNRQYNLRAKPNKSELSLELPNGSVVYLSGVDADEDEMHKILGQKFKLVVLDEGGSYNIDQRALVYGILKPAVADYQGQIAMIGTPTNYLNSLYFDVTTGKEPGWSVHKWSVMDNPHMARQWAEDLELLLRANPDIQDTPQFKQFYLGEWVVDLDALVYRYDGKKNKTDALPDSRAWQYVMGVDLGYDDKTTFVVCAYNSYDPCLYVVASYGRSNMIFTEVAETIRNFQNRFNVSRIIMDGANKQGVEEMIARYNLPIQIAEKQGKRDYIEMMNADFITGQIKLVGNHEDLEAEYMSLVWDEKKRADGRWEEHKACDNHFADATLYAWRWCYNYASKPKKTPPTEEERIEAAALKEVEDRIFAREQEKEQWNIFETSTILDESWNSPDGWE